MAPKMCAWMVLAMTMAMAVVSGVAVFPDIESPQYTVVHRESDFEIRLYRPSTWISTVVKDDSFSEATQIGSRKLRPYFQGSNINNFRMEMTAPFLTGIVPSGGPFCSSTFAVRFYVPSVFNGNPPKPLLHSDLTVENWVEKCVAVRPLRGLAKDSNVAHEAAQLELSLQKTSWVNVTDGEPKEGEDAYTIAQSFKIMERVTEVWVSFKSSEGCHAKLLNTNAGLVVKPKTCILSSSQLFNC